MSKLLKTIEVKSVNGLYRIHQYKDGNALPKLVIYQVVNGHEVPVKNMYGELKRLNEEFSFGIEHEPKERTRLNTREFGREFIRRYKGR
ncbi:MULTISPECIES: hypothetical protein [Bacillales]|uniref:Uncharacterized protein n=1 Tax=Ureibacillus massiliensis 4400831 = CIP 108448 = CCUG 49529 TaxID=1211035 RepID=A0A0A3IYU1_9BACL|nr:MULTISPECIES: hypothetical protein [Bacillales]KGR89846.1 hypothetical protein CD30_14740 [Ureibacillus massiliensis 4400831 = CIP 108448 = CCUG 49529]